MAYIDVSIPWLDLAGSEFDWTTLAWQVYAMVKDVSGLIRQWFYQPLDKAMDSHLACARFACLIQVRLCL